MEQIKVTYNLEREPVNQFEKLCDALGLPVETAINNFMKKTLREQKALLNSNYRTEFDYSVDNDDLFYSPENLKHLDRSIAEMEATGGTIHEVNYDD